MLKRTIQTIFIFCMGGILTFLLTSFSSGWERRFVLYHVMNELKKEMPKEDVELIVERHSTSFVKTTSTEDTINLWVRLDISNSLSLSVNFENGKLTSAKIFGEDNSADVPEDAPSNIN